MECHYCFNQAQCILTNQYELVCPQCQDDFEVKPEILTLESEVNDQKQVQVQTILAEINTDISTVSAFFSKASTYTNLMPLPLSSYRESQLKSLTLARDLFTTIATLLTTHPNLPLPAYTRFNQPLRHLVDQTKHYVSDDTLFKVLMQDQNITQYHHLYSNPAISIIDLLSIDNLVPSLNINSLLYFCQREDFTLEIFNQYQDKLHDFDGNLVIPFQVKLLPLLQPNISQTVLDYHPDITIDLIKQFPTLPWNFGSLTQLIPPRDILANPAYQWNWPGLTENSNLSLDDLIAFSLTPYYRGYDVGLWAKKSAVNLDIIIKYPNINWGDILDYTLTPDFIQNNIIFMPKYETEHWQEYPKYVTVNPSIPFSFIMEYPWLNWYVSHNYNFDPVELAKYQGREVPLALRKNTQVMLALQNETVVKTISLRDITFDELKRQATGQFNFDIATVRFNVELINLILAHHDPIKWQRVTNPDFLDTIDLKWVNKYDLVAFKYRLNPDQVKYGGLSVITLDNMGLRAKNIAIILHELLIKA